MDGPWGAEIHSCSSLVLVRETAEQIVSVYPAFVSLWGAEMHSCSSPVLVQETTE